MEQRTIKLRTNTFILINKTFIQISFSIAFLTRCNTFIWSNRIAKTKNRAHNINLEKYMLRKKSLQIEINLSTCGMFCS